MFRDKFLRTFADVIKIGHPTILSPTRDTAPRSADVVTADLDR